MKNSGTDLVFSDGIAAARTMLAVRANAGAVRKRLGPSWEVAPYAGDDMRGTSLRGANVLVPFTRCTPPKIATDAHDPRLHPRR